MKVAFHFNQLGERGSEIQLYDNAHYNEIILGNESIIISSKHRDLFALEKFRKRFPVYLYNEFSEVDKILENKNVDVFYAVKSGGQDGV